MLPINVSAADIDAWRYWRFQPPDPRVHGRLEALYWRRPRMATEDMRRRCGLSKASVHRDRKAYVTGGLAPVTPSGQDRPQRALTPERSTREAYGREHPAAPVGEAAAQITERTGMARRPTPVRPCWKALGLTPRPVGMLPAQADGAAHAAGKNPVWSPGERRPRRAHAPSCVWRPRRWAWRPGGGWSGAFNAWGSTRHRDGNACLS
jgi:hypothetical protein